MPPKIVTIIGATGIQGGSIVDSLLESGKYHVRGITRYPDSKAAVILSGRGVTIVQADIADLEALKKALAGSHAVFGLTDFFAHFHHGAEMAERIETEQGKTIAKAVAATQTVEHFIWSTLPDSDHNSHGLYHVPHFCSKAKVDEFIKADKVLLAKTTFIWMGFYADNFRYPMYTPSYVSTAEKWIQMLDVSADTTFPVVNPRVNSGSVVAAILAQPDKTRGGQYVLSYIKWITYGQLLQEWAHVHQVKAQLVEISSESYNELWPGWAAEMTLMSKYFRDTGKEAWSVVNGKLFLEPKDLGLNEQILGTVGAAIPKDDLL